MSEQPNSEKLRARALTLKQERFAAEYLVDFNATAAAVRAGYSSRNREARRQVDAEERGPVELPAFTPLDIVLAEPVPATRFRIEGLHPEGSRAIVAAQYKSGKTSLVTNLVRSLADGARVLERTKERRGRQEHARNCRSCSGAVWARPDVATRASTSAAITLSS